MSSEHDYEYYFNSAHLRGVDLPLAKDGGHTFRITAWKPGKEGDDEMVELILRDADQTGISWLTNKTNCNWMSRIFGSKVPAHWVKHCVTLAHDPSVKFGRETVGGIRVIGSPDISAPITFQFQENSRKKPRTVTLYPTGKGHEGPQQPDSGPSTAPESGDSGQASFGPESDGR